MSGMAGGNPPEEIEVKIRVPSLEPVLSRLSDLGALARRGRHLEDNLLFDFPDAPITRSGCLLRLRRRDGEAVVTFKGRARVEDGARVRSEREVRVEDPDTFRAILEGIGLRPVYRYQKFRSEFDLEGVRIAADELPFGCFLELEGRQDSIRRVASLLGFEPEDLLTETYRALHLDHASKSGEPMGDLLFQPPARPDRGNQPGQ